MKRIVLAVVVFVGLVPWALECQTTPAGMYAQGNYARCIAVADSILEGEESNAQAHYYKGLSLLALQSLDESKVSLEKALDYAFVNPVAVHANLLRVEAGLQSTSNVLARLDTLVKQNFAGIAILNRPEFEYLGDHGEFQKLREQVNRNANPCQFQPQYQKLDFWLGEWDVFVGGQKTADSYITKSQGGCSLHEDYRTLNGFFGTSYNFYDPVDSLHKQIWIDKFNNVVRFYEIHATANSLELEAMRAGGTKVRMNYTYDSKEDSVIQTMQSSTDDGINWTPSFSGTYRRKKVKD